MIKPPLSSPIPSNPCSSQQKPEACNLKCKYEMSDLLTMSAAPMAHSVEVPLWFAYAHVAPAPALGELAFPREGDGDSPLWLISPLYYQP